MFSKPSLISRKSSHSLDTGTRTLSVCVSGTGPGQKVSREMLNRFRDTVRSSPGCKWKLSHLPRQISSLLPDRSDEWCLVTAEGGLHPPNSSLATYLLEWGEGPISFSQDTVVAPQGTAWMTFSQPSSACAASCALARQDEGGRVGPGASRLTCSDPLRPGRVSVPRRAGPGASLLTSLEWETARPAMAMPQVSPETQVLLNGMKHFYVGGEVTQIRNWGKLVNIRQRVPLP